MPLIVTGELTVQVGGVAPAPVTAQLSATDPVNPPEGVTVMVEVPGVPPAVSVIWPLLLSVIAGVGVVVPPFCTVAVAYDGSYTELPEYCTVS